MGQGAAIDLNADLGESFGAWRMGDDEAMLDVVTSANVACGFHAGDPSVMRSTVAAAAVRGVAIGAHVSYPDLVGFGRRAISATPAQVTADVLYQLGALDAMARAAGTSVSYVKAHGALYHASAADHSIAAAVLEALCCFDRRLALLSPAGSAISAAAFAAGVAAHAEAFPDRAYDAAGNLVPREQVGAVVHDPAEVARRGVDLALAGPPGSGAGAPSSLCVHGDHPHAVAAAASLRAALEAAGFELRSFAPPR